MQMNCSIGYSGRDEFQFHNNWYSIYWKRIWNENEKWKKKIVSLYNSAIEIVFDTILAIFSGVFLVLYVIHLYMNNWGFLLQNKKKNTPKLQVSDCLDDLKKSKIEKPKREKKKSYTRSTMFVMLGVLSLVLFCFFVTRLALDQTFAEQGIAVK